MSSLKWFNTIHGINLSLFSIEVLLIAAEKLNQGLPGYIQRVVRKGLESPELKANVPTNGPHYLLDVIQPLVSSFLVTCNNGFILVNSF